MSQVVIISGPPGAGKSSVADALCERYDRTVQLETDDAYAWIRMGYVRPWLAGSSRQNEMVARACARAATAFVQDGYGVFIDGVIGSHLLPLYVEELRVAVAPVHYAVLLPPVEECIRRANAREKEIAGAGDDMFIRTHALFADAPKPRPWTLDNSGMTADQAADRVMDACGRGATLVWSP